MRHALVLFTLLLACADVPDDESADDFPELALANCPQGRCKAVRAHPALPLINEKRASLAPAIRDGYFAAPTAEIGTTPEDGNPYQWFAGPSGRGAIYVVRNGAVDTTLGVFHIYGPILEEWSRRDYERGLGYFTDPVVRGDTTRQVFAIDAYYTPSIVNGGHLRSRGVLVARADGTVSRMTQDEYLDSSTPGIPARSPQPCVIYEGRSIDGRPLIYPEVSLDGYSGEHCGTRCTYTLWCGPRELEGDSFMPDV